MCARVCVRESWKKGSSRGVGSLCGVHAWTDAWDLCRGPCRGVFKSCGYPQWAGLSASQFVLGTIRAQVGAGGAFGKGSSHSPANLCLCRRAQAGGMLLPFGSRAAGGAQSVSVRPKEVPKIRQRGDLACRGVGAFSCMTCGTSPSAGKGDATSTVVARGPAAGPWSLRTGEWSCVGRGWLEADFFLQYI